MNDLIINKMSDVLSDKRTGVILVLYKEGKAEYMSNLEDKDIRMIINKLSEKIGSGEIKRDIKFIN